MRRDDNSGCRSPFSSGKELLDRGEHHAPLLDGQLGPQVGPVPGLDGSLPQEVLAAGERAEELIVEIVTVRQHHDRRVLHHRLARDPSGVEGHGQAFARALGVPHDSDAPIAGIAARQANRPVGASVPVRVSRPLHPGRPQRLAHGRLNCMELVIPGHYLGQLAAAVVLEDDEVPDQRQKPLPLARPGQHHLQLGKVGVGQRLATHRAPRLEPLASGGEGAHPRVDSVRGDEQRVEREQVREFGLVGLDLIPGRPHRGLLVRRVLELDQTKRKTIDEQHDVRPPLVLTLDDSELVDGEPVVVCGVLVVDDRDLRSLHGTRGSTVLDGHAIHEQAVEGAVADFQVEPSGRMSLRNASSSASAGRWGSAGPKRPAAGVPERLHV